MRPIVVTVLADGVERQEVLSPAVVSAAKGLAESYEIFFSGTEGCERIPVASLVWSRLRQDSVAAAVSIMRRCAQAAHERRMPISVQELDDGRYLVLDGNSTAAVCFAAGWGAMPVHRVEPELVSSP